ncbi:MAG: type II toxin-antitoxin system YafQ family toxin [Desulfobacula sp.]|uniref:type II toxin-antitoxin system YafQ family toxin n=1 Tax=Desulfobacula sp. TaxID=2593537 RepID=UPI00345BF757|nr:type II toxin-antitoxin system YafQ family toxin [Desulfobacula sp.]
MLTPVFTRQFDKDVKRVQRRAKNLEKLKIIIRSLIAEESLDPIHRDHKLIGNWKGRRDCHIESNWLLIYKIEENRIIFERTGTHSDLFRK